MFLCDACQSIVREDKIYDLSRSELSPELVAYFRDMNYVCESCFDHAYNQTELGFQIDFYMEQPYMVIFHRLSEENGGGYAAEALGLPGCMSSGRTPEEARESLRDGMRLWLEAALRSGHPIKLPPGGEEHVHTA